MKQRKLSLMILVFLLTALVLDACSFSVNVLSTPTVSPPTENSLPPTAMQTSAASAPSAVLPSMTPTLISIRADTISMLEVFESLNLGDVVRSVAFTPDGTVLAAAGGNTDDFAVHIWEAASGQSLGNLDGHTGIILGVAFSPDGQMLASRSRVTRRQRSGIGATGLCSTRWISRVKSPV
jgi:WD40 repeat protein